MYIAVCDAREEKPEVLSNLLQLWQAEHRTRLRFKAFCSVADMKLLFSEQDI